MAQDILLTSPALVKSITTLGDNINEKAMQFAIRETQEYALAQVLGGAMIKKLKELVDSEQIYEPENSAYQELLNTAQYFIAYQVICELAIPLSYKFDNAGVTTTSDDHVENVNLRDIFAIKDYYSHKVDFYRLQLQRYVLANKENLPEIGESKCNEIKAQLHSSANTSIFLGGARGKRL